MRCSKCAFISFDDMVVCDKCSYDLTETIQQLHGSSLNIDPPVFLSLVVEEVALDREEANVMVAEPLEILMESGLTEVVLKGNTEGESSVVDALDLDLVVPSEEAGSVSMAILQEQEVKVVEKDMSVKLPGQDDLFALDANLTESADIEILDKLSGKDGEVENIVDLSALLAEDTATDELQMAESAGLNRAAVEENVDLELDLELFIEEDTLDLTLEDDEQDVDDANLSDSVDLELTIDERDTK